MPTWAGGQRGSHWHQPPSPLAAAPCPRPASSPASLPFPCMRRVRFFQAWTSAWFQPSGRSGPVSYTHLTLPTRCSV
eukprot:6119954-Alexandrium_andersonii.AAC.1